MCSLKFELDTAFVCGNFEHLNKGKCKPLEILINKSYKLRQTLWTLFESALRLERYVSVLMVHKGLTEIWGAPFTRV